MPLTTDLVNNRTTETVVCPGFSPLAAKGEEDLHEQRTQQLFRRNRRAAGMRVALIEQPPHVVGNAVIKRAQQSVLRKAFFKAYVADHQLLTDLKPRMGNLKSRKTNRGKSLESKTVPRTGVGVSRRPVKEGTRLTSPNEKSKPIASKPSTTQTFM